MLERRRATSATTAPASRRHRPASPAGSRRGRADHRRLPAEGHRQPVLRRREDRHRQGARPRPAARSPRSGPNEAKADLQIPFITDPTTQGVDAIIISADGKDEVAPALKAAMAAGIKVVGFDSSPAVGAYDVFVNQVDFSGVGVNLADWACELAPELHRRDRDPLGGRHGDEPERVDRADEDDPRRRPSTRASSSSRPSTATTTRRRARRRRRPCCTKYPNLKVIVAPTTVGILAAAQVVKQAGKSDSVKVTGLGFPNDMKPFVADGTSPVFGLWSVPDLGYLSYQVAAKLVSGEITGSGGRDLHRPGSQRGQAVHDRQGQRRHPRAGLPVRRDERQRLRLLARVRRARLRSPGRQRFRGSLDFGGRRMERVGFTMRLLPGAGGGIPPPARGRLARDARRAASSRCPRLLDLPCAATDLFGYLEVDDFAAFRASMASQPRQRPAGRRRWRR